MSAPFSISVTSDFERYARAYSKLRHDEVRFAAAAALTRTALAARNDIRAKMPMMFDKPTPSTQTSVISLNATPETLTATVMVKDFIGKGHSPQQWLAAEIEGGERRRKSSEKALIYAGIMEPDQFWTPNVAPNPPPDLLDQYGNVPSSRITQILSRMSAFGEQGYKANMTETSRKRLLRKGMLVPRNKPTISDYFVHRRPDGTPNALMQLVAKGDVRVVLWLTSDAPHYRVRFPFDDMLLGAVEKHFAPEMAAALERQIVTARR